MRIERSRYLSPLQEISSYKTAGALDEISVNFGILSVTNGSRTVNEMLFDNNFMYARDYSSGTIYKYTKSLSYIGATPYYGGNVEAFDIDDDYIYIGGSTTNTIRKYLKSDLSYVGESPSYGGNIRGLFVDDIYVYAGGGVTKKIRKYLKSDLSYVGESADVGDTIIRMKDDDMHIYVSGGGSLYAVKKYLKSDLSYVGITAAESSTIVALDIDDTHIFLSLGTTTKKYLKSDLSYDSQMSTSSNFIDFLVSDTALYGIYYSTPYTIRKYSKTFSLIAESFSNSYFSAVAKNTNFVYIGTTSTGNRIFKMFEDTIKYKEE